MCVRYTLHKPDAALAAIARALGKKLAPPEWAKPRYNVALTNVVPVVAASTDGPEARGMLWGFVPLAERGKSEMRMFPNARAETAASLPAFRQAVAKRRCLVPANGFYEWLTQGKLKRPHLFTLSSEEPFAFAGIWTPAEQDLPETFCLLTTQPNSLVASVHHRMPVLLTQASMSRWIGAKPLTESAYRELTGPFPAELMAVREVNRFVSNTRHEGPQCLEPPESAPSELELF